MIDRNLYDAILKELPVICVDIVIKSEEKVLLVKRRNSPAKDQWWFPGGRIRKGESIREAALRKASSETGLSCNFIDIVGIEETYFRKTDDMEFDIHTINIAVLMSVIGNGNISLDKDHSEHIWINLNSKC